jgi:hypothetical protein
MLILSGMGECSMVLGCRKVPGMGGRNGVVKTAKVDSFSVNLDPSHPFPRAFPIADALYPRRAIRSPNRILSILGMGRKPHVSHIYTSMIMANMIRLVSDGNIANKKVPRHSVRQN